MKHKVADWMTKHPLRIDIKADIERARDIMESEQIRHLLVTEKGNLVGILSQSDVCLIKGVCDRFKGLETINNKILVSDLMTRNPKVISENLSMTEAIRIMNENQFHSLPVMDDYGRLRGIITSTDVLKYALVAGQKTLAS